MAHYTRENPPTTVELVQMIENDILTQLRDVLITGDTRSLAIESQLFCDIVNMAYQQYRNIELSRFDDIKQFRQLLATNILTSDQCAMTQCLEILTGLHQDIRKIHECRCTIAKAAVLVCFIGVAFKLLYLSSSQTYTVDLSNQK